MSWSESIGMIGLGGSRTQSPVDITPPLNIGIRVRVN